MKIVVNARFLTQPLSGVQRYAIECSRQIKKLHPEVTFVAPKNILHKDIAKELNVIVTGFNTGHLWEQFDLPFYLARKGSPPLVSLANTGPILYSSNYITIHDLAFYHHPEWNSKKFSAWYNILIPRLAHGSRHIFTVSETIREEINKYYKVPLAKISVTYNGISQNMMASKPQHPVTKEKIILSVGTFNIRKNHQNLVAGYLASDLRNGYQLVLIGDKNKVFRESGLDERMVTDDNIKIYEIVNEQELIDIFHRAEIVTSLSLYEGFGIPLLEGLYNGCKILCSDIPVYHELYDSYATFCDPLNIENVSKSLNIISKISATSIEKVNDLLQKCSYSRSAEAILDVVLTSK
jgi:glycosyltransferase involved in cell wall biosynthesis